VPAPESVDGKDLATSRADRLQALLEGVVVRALEACGA
jgi:hypothetical protein